MDDEVDPSQTLQSLTASLEQVEKLLDPIFSKPWHETLEALDVLQRAKLEVLVSYAVNDLVWVYMQIKGLKSEEHGVQVELDRLKRYFSKIKFAEDPETRKQTIDKAAAARFITHAIPVSQRIAPTAAAQARDRAIAAMDVDEEVGMSTRFKHVGGVAGDENMDDEAEALLEGVLEASLAAGEISEGNGTDGIATPPVPVPTAKAATKKDKVEKGDKVNKVKKSKAGAKSAKAKAGKGTK